MRLLRWLPALLWTAVILSASNDGFSSDRTAEWLHAVVGQELPEAANSVVRKGGHIIGYSVLALLLWLADSRVLRPLVLAAAVAIADETKQSYTLFREGSPYDVVLDTASAALVLLVLEKIRYGRRARRARAATGSAPQT